MKPQDIKKISFLFVSSDINMFNIFLIYLHVIATGLLSYWIVLPTRAFLLMMCFVFPQLDTKSLRYIIIFKKLGQADDEKV